MKFLVFAASHRPDSVNRKLARLAAAHLAAQGATIDFAEYGEFDMPLYNATLGLTPATRHFGERVASASGIIISSPEYNWSYPGSLKNIIDWTSCITPKPLAGRTALLMSATPGSRGGILGLSHLKTPLESQQMFVFPRVFPLSSAERAFDSNQALVEERPRAHLATLLDEYLSFTRNLSKS